MERANDQRGRVGLWAIMYGPLKPTPPKDCSRWHAYGEYTPVMQLEDIFEWCKPKPKLIGNVGTAVIMGTGGELKGYGFNKFWSGPPVPWANKEGEEEAKKFLEE